MNTIELQVDGMSCQKCVASVQALLEQQAGVSAVVVDLNTKLATVSADERFDRQAAINAINDAGFDAQ